MALQETIERPITQSLSNEDVKSQEQNPKEDRHHPLHAPLPTSEETEQERIERLGRERPPQLKSLWAEVLFVYSILASQFMAVSLYPRGRLSRSI